MSFSFIISTTLIVFSVYLGVRFTEKTITFYDQLLSYTRKK